MNGESGQRAYLSQSAQSSQRKNMFAVDKGKSIKRRDLIQSLEELEGLIEDMEDTVDLLWTKKEAICFTPYEKFRKEWLSLGVFGRKEENNE